MGRQKKNPEKAGDLNRIGNEHYERGEYSEAKEYYEKAVKADKNFADGYYNIGLVYKAENRHDDAAKFFEKAIDANPDYSEAMNQLGIYHYDNKRYDESEKYYLMALERDDKLYYVYYNLALIEGERKNREKRLEYIEKSLKIKPDYSLALNEMGNLYYDESDYDNAHTYYEKAYKSDHNNKYAAYNLGLIAEINSDYALAKDFYDKSIEIDPAYDLPAKKLKEISDKVENDGKPFNRQDSQKGDTEKGDSFIKKIGRNLNELAREGKLNEVLGRGREIEAIFEILFKRFKNNPLLIGNPGVGKTAIVEGIANMIVSGNVPEQFRNKEIIELNTGFLIAGTKYRGDFEIKIKKILDDARGNHNIILFIDEIHTIIGAGRVEDSSLDIAQILKPALQNGEITCIGATTTNEYRRYIEKDAALERRFYPVMIEELSPGATREILYSSIDKANSYYNIEYSRENVDEIVDLSSRYLKKRYFPDKAIDIFEKLASRNSLKKIRVVKSSDIKTIIGEMAGISFIENDDDEIRRLADLEPNLKKDIFGQDEAIRSICNIIRIAKRRFDLKPEQPDGVFLLTGPTGTGKTYMAKCLCRHLFGSDNKLMQLDMTEFSEPHSVSKIIGAPPGYVGFETSPPLTDFIEDNPTSILLLDEIEKADINVIRLFLQIFEEGKILNSKGKKVYFSDVTVIMTSNALYREKGSMGFLGNESPSGKTDGIVNALTQYFPKEFLNRVDEIIVFNSLSKDDVRNILVNSVLKAARERFAVEHIDLEFDLSLEDWIIEEGYSPELGARNIHRVFESRVLAPLVQYIFDKNPGKGRIMLSFENGELKIG